MDLSWTQRKNNHPNASRQFCSSAFHNLSIVKSAWAPWPLARVDVNSKTTWVHFSEPFWHTDDCVVSGAIPGQSGAAPNSQPLNQSLSILQSPADTWPSRIWRFGSTGNRVKNATLQCCSTISMLRLVLLFVNTIENFSTSNRLVIPKSISRWPLANSVC